jgi:Na+-transporting NADH:ubiquinone oxidoreductase subunit F
MPSVPHGPRFIINSGERILTAEPGAPLLFSAMAEKIFIPSACGGKASCGQCRVRVRAGAPDYLPAERAILSREEMARGIHLACQLAARGEMEVELPEGCLGARQYLSRVTAIREPAPEMREVELELLDPPRMGFLAGQYVQVLRPGSEKDPHPVYRAYSMASPPSRETRLVLLFARVLEGEITSWVFNRLRIGDNITLNGPFGTFRLQESARQIILVAGGSGIAPMRSMLAEMAEKGISRRCMLFFSARTAEDLVYRDEMRGLEQTLPGFAYIPVLSRPAPADRWAGETGGLPAALMRLLPGLNEHEAYLCGGPGLIGASISVLKAKGLSDERILFDKFS